MMKRILVVLLAAALMLSAASCGVIAKTTEPALGQSAESGQSEISTSEDGSSSTSGEQEISVLDLPEDPAYARTVLKVGEYEVSYGLYRYFYCMIAKSMAGGDGEYFEKNPQAKEQLAADVLERCKSVALYYDIAKMAGFNLPSDEKITEEFESYIKQYEPMYPPCYGITMAQYLEQRYLPLSVYKTLYILEEYLTEPVYNYLADEKNGYLDLSEEAVAEAMKEFRCVKHILVGYTDGLSEEKALELATNLAGQLRDGADLDALMREYSNDYNANGENAYIFTHGEMVEEFEEKSFALEIGEVSDPVKTVYGYHVIVRLEIDAVRFKTEKLLENAVGDAFLKLVEQKTVETTEAFADCTYEKITGVGSN